MTNPTIHVLIVTDMSGSMASLAGDVRGGFNAYLAKVGEEARQQNLNFRFTVTLFDTEFIPLCKDAELSEVPPLTHINYTPRGMTALLDAVGKTITEFQGAGPEDRVVLVVQTDGNENSSREWSWPSVQALIKEKTDAGWAVVYLGQGASAWQQGRYFEAAGGQSVNTSHSRGATFSAYSGMAAATVDYAVVGNAEPEKFSKRIAEEPGIKDAE